MTYIRKNLGMVLAAALLVALSGCKKEEGSGMFTIVGDTSYYFEYDQTKEVYFSASNIVSYDEPTVPDGWSCVREDGVLVITSPAEGTTDADLQGTITISATTTKGTAITRTVSVAVRIAEDITAPANSYIVSEPGKRYKFKTLGRGNETAETLEPVAANILWTTADAPVGHVSLEGDYLMFATADAGELVEGNALVAAIDKDGHVIWSWHIWVTDYDPATEYDLVGTEKVMARNLGALADSDASSEDAWLSFGLLYQWGRKDPFAGPEAYDSSATERLYSSLGKDVYYAFIAPDEETGTLDYITSRPTTFIAGAEDNDYNWLWETPSTVLWSATEKTVYDPCPAGWRVAPSSIWEGFTTTGAASENPAEFNVDGEYNYGWTFNSGAETIFYPAAGRRSFSPSLADYARNYTNIVNDENGIGYPVGFYWASDGVALEFRHDYIDPVADLPRAGGFPLRCVEE